MKKRLILILTVVIGICTLGLIATQVKWIQTTTHAEREDFEHSVLFALEQVVADLDRQEVAVMMKDGIPARVFQTYGSPAANSGGAAAGPVEQRISPPLIDSLLRHELRLRKIFISYDFAVTDAVGAILFETEGFAGATPEQTYSVALFANSPGPATDYYLSVYLPHYNDYVFHAVAWLIVVSVLLTLIITGTFAATLITIFRQKRLSEIKADFVNNITHELKTPITTISLAAQMLQDPALPDLPANVPRMAGMVSHESKRLLHLVESILQSAVFERGKIKLSVKEIDMHALIKDVLAQFAIQFDTLQVTVGLCLEAHSAVVTGDEVHLANVLSNLIDNAIKYRKEAVPLHITIETENKHAALIVSVTDNGIGIDGHSSKHLFDRFYRNPAENVHTVKGFGLGLYYVKNMVETHNGKLFAFGKPGKGSTFGFELPLANTVKTNRDRV